MQSMSGFSPRISDTNCGICGKGKSYCNLGERGSSKSNCKGGQGSYLVQFCYIKHFTFYFVASMLVDKLF
jgi:hypothetical protein